MLFFDQILVGYRSTVGAWQLSAEEVTDFARTWDPHPFHVDGEAARESVFGELVASSLHLFAYPPFLRPRRSDPGHGDAWKRQDQTPPTRAGDRPADLYDRVYRAASLADQNRSWRNCPVGSAWTRFRRARHDSRSHASGRTPALKVMPGFWPRQF